MAGREGARAGRAGRTVVETVGGAVELPPRRRSRSGGTPTPLPPELFSPRAAPHGHDIPLPAPAPWRRRVGEKHRVTRTRPPWSLRSRVFDVAWGDQDEQVSTLELNRAEWRRGHLSLHGRLSGALPSTEQRVSQPEEEDGRASHRHSHKTPAPGDDPRGVGRGHPRRARVTDLRLGHHEAEDRTSYLAPPIVRPGPPEPLLGIADVTHHRRHRHLRSPLPLRH